MPVVLYEKKDRIAYITVNRPEVLNAINQETVWALTEAWIDVRDDPDVWAAIITGAGERAFSAGADLKEKTIPQPKIKTRELPQDMYPPLLPTRGLEVYKPFIAAINGIATGGGLEIALACDIRIAAEHAQLGQREVVQGIMPGWGGTQRLPRFVPFSIAMEILLTGDFISAEEAYRIGLVNRVVPAAELMPAAEAMARRINENGPLAVRAIKEAVYRGSRMPLEDALHLERALAQNLNWTEDAKEGPLAFTQKRKPEYKAR